MMTRAQKAEEISALSERLGRAKAAFLVDYKGLNVDQVTRLRKSLSPSQSEMKVVRNTLAKRAMMDHPDIESALSENFVGTNAFVFAYEDPSASAKAIAEFAKEAEVLEIKNGVMDGKALDQAKIKYLATLPSKEQLQAQLLGVLAAPMTKILGTMDAVPAGFARLLNAYKDTKE